MSTGSGSLVRADGRLLHHIRPLKVEFSILKGADGSARVSLGERTSVVVAVYGPAEHPQLRKCLSDKASVEVIVRSTCGPLLNLQKSIEATAHAFVSNVVDIHSLPALALCVVVQPVGRDANLLACCLNGIMCALIDAAVPCIDTCFAVTIATIKKTHLWTEESFSLHPHIHTGESADPLSEVLIADPSLSELSSASVAVNLAFSAYSQSLVMSLPVKGVGWPLHRAPGRAAAADSSSDTVAADAAVRDYCDFSDWSNVVMLGTALTKSMTASVRSEFEKVRLTPIQAMFEFNNAEV
eukprot:Lankesteria_metandrocarpae@DN5270_c1_g2_i1.p2